MNDEVFSDVRYVHSSQDLLTNMPFALFPPDEGMTFVSVAGIRQLQMVRRMEVLMLTSFVCFYTTETPWASVEILQVLYWCKRDCFPGSDVLL